MAKGFFWVADIVVWPPSAAAAPAAVTAAAFAAALAAAALEAVWAACATWAAWAAATAAAARLDPDEAALASL